MKAVVIIIGIILQALFIAVEHKEKYVPAVALKGLASLCFVILGAMTKAFSSDQRFAKLIFIGLIFGMLGDILLNLRFVFEKMGQKIFLVGIVAFLTGHILYLAALIPKSSSPVIGFIIGAVIAAVLLWYIFKTMEVKLAFKIFGVIYLGAVIIMTAIAVLNMISSPTAGNMIYALGAVLFTVSDIVLIFNTFGKESKFSLRITNLSLYYAGQILIALSLMHF